MPRKVMARKSLSKGVLAMKFMQKSKETREEDEQRNESRAILSKSIPKVLKSAGVEIKCIDSYIELEELTSGRMSFNGMNPHVEKIMQHEQEKKLDAFLAEQRLKSNQPDISDEAMASTLSKNMQSRFNTKKFCREHISSDESDGELLEKPAKKPKFLKPEDD